MAVIKSLIICLGVGSRLFHIEQPRNVTFDEVVHLQYLNLYNQRSLFFDAQPPLGKQLLFLAGRLAGISNQTSFRSYSTVGAAYEADFPVAGLRLLPAVCGGLIPLLAYSIVIQISDSSFAASLAALYVIFENGLLTHHRLIGVDSIANLLSSAAVISALKYQYQWYQKSPKRNWYLLWTGVSLGLSFCIKYSTVYSWIVLCVNICWNSWKLVYDASISLKCIGKRVLLQLITLVGIPVVLYGTSFSIHIWYLNRAGPQINILSTRFRQALAHEAVNRNDLGKATSDPSDLSIGCGSQITLRSYAHSPSCWLHSSTDTLYPLRYPDGRGSSHQQMVTCYARRDVNNWWIIYNKTTTDSGAGECSRRPSLSFRDGDVVELVHGVSGRSLNSHDVGAPRSPKHQEVSCYIDHDISMEAYLGWRISLSNGNKIWRKSSLLPVKLIHEATNQTLMLSGKYLGSMKDGQIEVAAGSSMRLAEDEMTQWIVEEHKPLKGRSLVSEAEHFHDGELQPVPKMSILEKFVEIHERMFDGRSLSTQDGHLFECTPMEWTLADCTMPYFADYENQKQVHLVGNPVVYLGCFVVGLCYGITSILLMIMRNRGIISYSSGEWKRYQLTLRYLFPLYLANWVPYFFYQPPLFLYHYFPSLIILIAIAWVAVGCSLHDLRTFPGIACIIKFSAVIWTLACLICYKWLLPLCYGIEDLPMMNISERFVWKKSWDTLVLRIA